MDKNYRPFQTGTVSSLSKKELAALRDIEKRLETKMHRVSSILPEKLYQSKDKLTIQQLEKRLRMK